MSLGQERGIEIVSANTIYLACAARVIRVGYPDQSTHRIAVACAQLGIDRSVVSRALAVSTGTIIEAILIVTGKTGENSPGRDKLCLGGGPHADGACHCCSCVHRVRIDRGRTRLVRVPAADGQRTSSVTSGGQAVLKKSPRLHSDRRKNRIWFRYRRTS